ncbi:MAG: flagellar basal body P-ring formation chaperone FlgA, partial [Gammaproteobacteria bacterium]|nr:flagellar basal body P-ring formation chaperone FlgA [Gammaproteobacteria bacterium]
EIGYLDQRVKLDKCTEPLEVFLPVGAKPLGNSSLGVRCQGNKRWKIHVPVKIIRFSNVLTAKRTLIRGNPITIDDVQNSRIDISHISNGYFTDINEISGMVLKQGLSQGQVIRNGMLEIPRLIKRGEMVTILVNTRTIEVRMKGEALMDGRKNEIIQVKNHNSNKVIQAQVVSSGTVQVTM